MQRLTRRFVRAGLAGLTLSATLAAATTPTVQFSDTKLKNGLRVLIAEDHNAPVFSVAISYNVGSRDERPGRTGFAHLFEHMMFKGSENVGPGEHFMLIFGSGGSMNGTTDQDRTLYYDTLPANQLDLALFLEADRMRSLDITQANLDNQRNAVQEERRSGVDNQPYGKTFEAIDALAYKNFAYSHSVIGSMTDLNAASVADVAAFFRTYYAPNNAVMAIVGDIKSGETITKVRQYFEPIPMQPAPTPVDMTEPAQTEERRQTIDDPLARLPRIDISFHTPPSDSPDDDAIGVLASVLSNGRSSRMYESLVHQKQLTSNVSCFNTSPRGPGLFRVSATALPGKAMADVEAAIYVELEKVKSDAIAPWEMEKARNSVKRGVVGGMTSSLNRAVQLSQDALFYNDPNRINTRVERVNKVTAADVQRVAAKYLTPTNRSVVITNPKAALSAPNGGR